MQNPVCAPSRASLLTGQYSARARAVGERRRVAAATEPLFTEGAGGGGLRLRHDRQDAPGGLPRRSHRAAPGRRLPQSTSGRTTRRTARRRTPTTAGWSASTPTSTPRVDRARLRAEPGTTRSASTAMPTEAHYSRWVGERTIDFLRDGRDARPAVLPLGQLLRPAPPVRRPAGVPGPLRPGDAAAPARSTGRSGRTGRRSSPRRLAEELRRASRAASRSYSDGGDAGRSSRATTRW